MIRRKISLAEFAARAAETLPKGVLLTARAGDQLNLSGKHGANTQAKNLMCMRAANLHDPKRRSLIVREDLRSRFLLAHCRSSSMTASVS